MILFDANKCVSCNSCIRACPTPEANKAVQTEDGRTVVFRPDLNAERMANSARRLEMPAFPEDRFVDAVLKTVKANEAYVPPFGSGATLYIRIRPRYRR